MISRKKTYQSVVYWDNLKSFPLEEVSRRAEIMREAWTWAYNSGYYQKLPKDLVKADERLMKVYEQEKGD